MQACIHKMHEHPMHAWLVGLSSARVCLCRHSMSTFVINIEQQSWKRSTPRGANPLCLRSAACRLAAAHAQAHACADFCSFRTKSVFVLLGWQRLRAFFFPPSRREAAASGLWHLHALHLVSGLCSCVGCVCNDLCVWRDRQRYAQMSNQRDSHTRCLLVCMRCAACVRAAHTHARARARSHTHTHIKLLVYEA